MKNEIASLRRETEKLRSQVGAEPLRPVYHLFDENGNKTALVDMAGKPVDAGENDVEFSVIEAPFSLLFEGKKHTAIPHGRGAGITNSIARYTLGLAVAEPCRILCAREVQLSLKESVWFLLTELIDRDAKLREFFTVQQDGIYGRNGSQFLFKGIQNHTAESLKSYENLKYCWIEESQSISRRSHDVLVPTVRAEGARFFWSINQRSKDEIVTVEYLADERPDTARPESPFTIYENPFATETLLQEAELLKQRDPERHRHVYLGGFETYSEARIFRNFIIQPFDIEEIIQQRISVIKVGYHGTMREQRARRARQAEKIKNAFGVGIDFGTVDPFTILLTYLDETFGRLFVLREFYQTGLDPDGMLKALQDFPLPSPKFPIFADHRPELIGYLYKHKFNISPAVKLNLLERIDALKRFDIIVSPECPRTIEEFGLYSWQRGPSGVVFGDQPEDANNHCIDAICYSLGERLRIEKPKGRYQKLEGVW